jgi:hypothetical protein
MATAQEIINSALRLIGVLAAGETASAEESSDSLTALNDMLSLWTIDRLMVYQYQQGSKALTPNDGIYTIGSSGADITDSRPLRIESAFIRDSSGYDSSLTIINQDEYNRITTKSTASTYPNRLFYDPSFPNGTIYLYPVPSVANTLYYTVSKQFSSFATLGASATFPPGYTQLIKYNLAVLLAAEFNTPVRPDVVAIAQDTKEKIETLNNRLSQGISLFDSSFSRFNVINFYADNI